ncbi:MAG: hypothetical protein N2595_03985 [bacterium]|nr:hypothetical protein [bacterium]
MVSSSREIVYAAVHFQRPARLPVRMASLGVDDTAWIWRKTADRVENGARLDEWGCRWEHTDVPNMGQVKGHPLSCLAAHESLRVPDYSQDWMYEECDAVLRAAEEHEKYTQAGIFMVLFERMHALAGFETVLTGLLDDRDNAAALADKILGAQINLVRNFQERFGRRLHSFSMSDDWGSQRATFISPALWYEFFFPRYKRLFEVMHAGGQDVWVHSCGRINELIQGFIDAGADVINLQQPRALGIAAIGERYRGKVAFESLADIQVTLPTGDVDKIRADAEELGLHWMLPEGGFIFSDYGDDRAIGAPEAAKRCMYAAFSRVSERVYGAPLPELP